MTGNVPLDELGEFLKKRRSELSPRTVGLPESDRPRRVAGLRREEVAQLAGISTDYYMRLEQGRMQASAPVLDVLARVLRLDDDEPAMRTLYADWETSAQISVAQLRMVRRPRDWAGATPVCGQQRSPLPKPPVRPSSDYRLSVGGDRNGRLVAADHRIDAECRPPTRAVMWKPDCATPTYGWT